MKTTKQDKFILSVLDQMFKVVGLSGYDPEFVKQQNWYLLHEWTPEQEEAFKEWAVKEYQKIFKCSLYSANKHVGFFLMSYGWKTKHPQASS